MEILVGALAAWGLLMLISFGIYHSLQAEMGSFLTTLLLCAGGGMLGGMVS